MKPTLQHFIPGYRYLSDETLEALIRDLQGDLRSRAGKRASDAAWVELVATGEQDIGTTSIQG